VLDDVAGLGEVRRKALLVRFGSLKKLAQATVEDILEVPGIGRRTAEAIITALRGDDPAPDLGEQVADTGHAGAPGHVP
jgi:excinuclease ABC subunit C